MTFKLGLTGSIGMGKSTTARVFAEFDIPVWDADSAVHKLYTEDTKLISEVSALIPGSVVDNVVDRTELSKQIRLQPDLLGKIEKIVHPSVAKDRQAFILNHSDSPMLVLDVPLIYETDQADQFDAVLVVTIDPEEQRRRVLAREGMTEEKFQMILSKQVPDAEKRALADYVIETKSLDHVRKEVQTLIHQIAGR